ncbi:hypothetical protein Q4I28_004388 [Leishmania naiffi]|uniref:Uncharacterized protein n=1 Tax=Leishmania naiffi TaxID=5678 RepID=A0AAW3BML5_9TRYP
MDSTDAASTAVWAFATAPSEGVPVLEVLAREFEWLGALPLDDLLTHTDSHHGRVTGARELMSALLSVSMPCPSPAQVALYVVFASRVYVALFVETVERKRRRLPSESSDLFAHTQKDCLRVCVYATMQAWTRDLVPFLVHSVLPCLHLRDAEPTTVRASNPSACPPGAPKVSSDDEAENNSTEKQRELLDALDAYCVREELVRLVVAVYRTTSGEDDAAAALLLAAYAALCYTEPSRSPASGQRHLRGSAATTLQQWRTRFWDELHPAASSNTTTERAAPPDTITYGDLDAILTPCLRRLREIAAEPHCYNSRDPLSFALTALQACAVSTGRADALHAADVERGTAPPDNTAAGLAMEHDRDVEASTLVALDALDVHSCEAAADPPEELLSLSLCRQGALLLLADALRYQCTLAAQQSFAYSVSASSLLLGVADAYVVALRCVCSSAVLLRHLLFLHDILSAVPKYTLCCAEEAGASQLRPSGQRSLDSCLTRRYEAFFDMAKELLTISALCPVEEHRQMSRIVVLELLGRLEERARIRMHGSLMALCPYPSIARFFLEEFLREWRATKSETDRFTAPQASPTDSMTPFVLQQCAQAFLTQVSSGTSGFVDPLVVVLNFVRVEVSQRAWIRSSCPQAAMSGPGDEVSSVCCAWSQFLGSLRERLLPRCHALMEKAATLLDDHQATPFSVEVSLSPLDLFSLSCAVEGLEQVLG